MGRIQAQPTRARFVLMILFVGLMTFAAQRRATAAPEPAKRRPSTGHDEYAGKLALNRRTLVDTYQQVGKKDAAWDDAAVRFLDATAAYLSRAGLEAVYVPDDKVLASDARVNALALGETAVKAGCDDPLVLYCYGVFLTDTGNTEPALPVFLRADKGLQAGDYPLLRKYASAKRIARINPNKQEAARSAATAQKLRVQLLCEKLDDPSRRMFLKMVWEDVGAEGGLEARQGLVAALDKMPDADPWVRDVLAGLLHVDLAWQSRGSRYADEVTDAQWAGFFEHLTKARARLTRAWKLAPHLPEAPEAMISVAMGGGEQLGEKTFDWFERALDAQVDRIRSYEQMFWALQPRWGGSHEQILEVGMACVQTGRYDTVVPWQLIVALWKIREDARVEWPELLADETTYAKVVEVTQGYAKARAGTRHEPWYKTYHAAVAWRAGKLEEARGVLEALGKNAQPSAFTEWGAKDGALTIAEVYARTGPHADALAEAAGLLDRGDAAGAATKLAAVKVPADDPSSHYVTALARLADWRVKFETGQWLDIQPRGTFAGWKKVVGTWTLDADGAVVGNGEASTRLMLMVWTGADLGGAPFELAGTVEFPVEPGPGKEAGNGGPAVMSDATGRQGRMSFDRDDQNAAFHHSRKSPFGAVEVAKSNEFLLRRDADGAVTVDLNGKQVIELLALSDAEFADPVRFGVGGSSRAGVPVRYTKLRIRKLIAPEAGKAAEPPAPGDKLPF